MLRPAEISEFCFQLSAMTAVGLPLDQALELMQKGPGDRRMKTICQKLREKIYEGCSLSDAMEQSSMFPELAVHMFGVAELGGRLGKTAYSLAVHYQKEHRLHTRIQNALLYPRLLCAASLALILVIFLAVMPTVEPLLDGLELPVITKFLMLFSSFMRQEWPAVMIFAFSFPFLWQLLMKNRIFRYQWDKGMLKLPVIKRQICLISTARFAESLSSLYSCGIPVTKSLIAVSKTLGNRYLERQIMEAAARVQAGEALSRAVSETEGLDERLAAVIYVGEETGRLDTMLARIADSYEYESDAALFRLTELLQPAVILLLGAVICVVVLAVMLPLWSMYENIG